MNPTGRLHGRVAVVTGGASGIGLATAVRFADEGAHVVIADVDLEAGVAASNRVNGAFVPTDVTDAAQVGELFAVAHATFGSVDVAFNNAGILPARRHIDPGHTVRRMAASPGRQPHVGVPVLSGRAALHAAPGSGIDHQHRVIRGSDGIGDVADLLHSVKGRRSRHVA